MLFHRCDVLFVFADVENAAVHEVGHFGGLGDIYEPGYPQYVPAMGSGNQDVTMYGVVQGSETKKRTLEQPDIDGMQFIYQNLPQTHVDVMLVFDASVSFNAVYDGFVP